MPQNVIPDSKCDTYELFIFLIFRYRKERRGHCVGLYQEVQSN